MKKLKITSVLVLLALSSCAGSSSSTKPTSVSYDSISSSIDSTSNTSSNTNVSTNTTNTPTTNVTTNTPSTTTTSSTPSTNTTSNPTSNTTTSSSTPSSDTPVIDGNVTFSGVDNCEVAKGQYFNPLKNVTVNSNDGLNLLKYLSVKGQVNYGKVGSYSLTYIVKVGNTEARATRIVNVVDKAISRTSRTKTYQQGKTTLGSGSYRTGDGAGLEAQPLSPNFVDEELLNKPLPSNGWWTSLISENYGRKAGIYTNPMRYSFDDDGVEITNNGAGFTQYWRENDGALSVASFSLATKDLVLKANNLNANYITKVIDYSDNAVKVGMRNTTNGADEMVVTMVQGSPFLFAEFNNSQGYFHLNSSGRLPYEFYTLSGQKLTDTYTDSSLIIKLPDVHVGYMCTVPSAPGTNVGAAIYQDRYYLVNAPENTTFTFTKDKHANDAFKDKVSFTSTGGNYFSICPINDLSEANYYNQHGYSFIHKANSDYEVNHDRSLVTTSFYDTYANVKGDDNVPLLGLLPHQYQYSNNSLTNKKIKGIRGDVKIIESNSFTTEQSFYGMLPTYTLPTNSQFSSTDAISYLKSLDDNTNETFGDNDETRKGPYWDAKTFYPLAQGVVFADQLNQNSYKTKFLTKLKAIIADWLTYDNDSDESYLYYNQKWGTMYYSNNDFNTASELSDHHFTHGYIVYAASVACMYDSNFYNQYKDMIKMLLMDYMTYETDSSDYPELRSFDKWAGHSWAHGYGFFAEGNNQESSGEALNSWVAGYLFGLQEGNQQLVDAAIYGFTTELNAIKQYVFDYDDLCFTKEYSDVVNISSIIWGGKNTYATWFGLNPNFVYGIHYLPIGQYVSSYAIGAKETQTLKDIYAEYLKLKVNFKDTWMSNMWSVQALYDADAALNNFSASKILNDDYPNDLISAYWNINAIKSLGTRSDDVFVTNSDNVASDVYKSGDKYTAQLWNSSNTTQTVNIIDANGIVLKTAQVPARSFINVTL